MIDEQLKFIERASRDAEGFHYLPGKTPFEKIMATIICEGHQYIIREKTFKDIIYPHLLNAAIEGFNKLSYYQNNDREIVSRRWGIEILNYGSDSHSEKRYLFEATDNNSYNTNQAKESSLKYIYKQEISNAS